MFLESVLNGIGTGLGFLLVLIIAGVIAWQASGPLFRRIMASLASIGGLFNPTGSMGAPGDMGGTPPPFSANMICPTCQGDMVRVEETTVPFGDSDNPR
ncbi:MAG: hypothetical protein IH919_07820 [Deltaproteobacteria bacterium]|nr:hypothetical protein [Deltaproteobacteria bacterium]